MKKLTNEEFINRCKEKYNYDYSITNYINSKTKIKFICSKHGIQEQLPYNHLKYGCKLCGKEIGYNSRRFSKEEIIEQFKKIHGSKYDYSKINYINIDTKIEIICPIHGSFWQSPYEHKNGANCPMCYGRNKSNEEFIEEVRKIHGNKYDYSLVDYRNVSSKVKIICPKHGLFEQCAGSHLQGHGCPYCKESKGEKFIADFLTKNNINFKREFIFENCKDKRGLPFDFYLKDYNICIEYDGIQHFENKFGTLDYIKRHDKIKNEFCQDNRIKLIRIPYYLDKNEIIKLLYNVVFPLTEN